MLFFLCDWLAQHCKSMLTLQLKCIMGQGINVTVVFIKSIWQAFYKVLEFHFNFIPCWPLSQKKKKGRKPFSKEIEIVFLYVRRILEFIMYAPSYSLQ